MTLLQRLVTNEYGERMSTADDIIYALTNKEETVKDKSLYNFLTYVFPIIGGALHCLVTFFYLSQ